MMCLFCNSKFIECNKIVENKQWVSILDGYPLTRGHTLIIPKKHIESIFQINIIMVLSFIRILLQTKKYLDTYFCPTSYNIGINDGYDAGQTIPHLHVHLIPRYKNDGGLPCGVRNIFPKEKANYLNK